MPSRRAQTITERTNEPIKERADAQSNTSWAWRN